MEPRLLVLLAALASAAIAGPISLQESTTCATECSPSTSKFNYAPGTTYLYDYTVDTVTSMAGASEESAKLSLTTTVEMQVLSQCEMVLSLRDTRLFHSEPNGGLRPADREESFRRSLESSSLRFSFQNGMVDHVCPGDREDAWALNIKKGVLSAFQNSMENLNQAQNTTETDVSGRCETEYTILSTGYYSNNVRKVKDVLTCTDRMDYNTFFQMVPYSVSSDIQSIPVMKSSHQCDQEIQVGGVLKSSICTESHVYRPFSNGQSGGATSVTQTLTYKTYKSGVTSRKDSITNRDSLVFDHSSGRKSPEQAREYTEKTLREICESTAFDVRPESPRQFTELVSSLKSLDKQALEEILLILKTKSFCPNNNKAYKSFLDALPMTGTSASVSLMTSLIGSDDITGLQAKAWIASLAFVKVPTSEMLLDAKALIDNEKVREEALLPVTSMVNNFCDKSEACNQSYAVLSVMASLERIIGPDCHASGKNFYQILLALRAVGNAGHSTRAISVINKCLTNTYNPLEIRVAAAQAFRRMPCEAEDSDLWATYQNQELDSELRLAAYRALVRCPSDVTLGKLAASLDAEQDEQVGAFVYSHLTNLKETSDPHKQDVVRTMDNLVIPSKFESNPMKTSTNLEASALINKINTGFVAESDLVWSNNAQLPRSAAANLTVELFGQSVNIIDFGGRLEGLEFLIKSTLGFGMEGLEAKPIAEENVQGSIYGRLFGNEMFFMHSKYAKSPMQYLPENWLDLLITLSKKQDVSLTHSQQIIEANLVVPTSAGLPLNVFVNGSAMVNLVLNGKADIRKAGSSPRSLDIDGEIRPSAAMEITGAMSVDAFVTKTGLRMRNSLHTSTFLKGRIQLERGQELNIELDTPQDKMEIFDASSKFFIVHNEVESEQKMITQNRKEYEACTCDNMAVITGVVLCGKVSYPNASLETEGPYFPLTGPSSANIVLRKTDSHSGYKLLAKRVENKKMSVAQVSFNTPGSREDRVVLLDLTLNYPDQSIDAQIVSPWAKVAAKGALMNKKDIKSIAGSVTIDDSRVYALTSEVKVSKSKSKLHLAPMVEIRAYGMPTVQLSGFIAMEKPYKSVDLDLSLSGLQELPYNVKASVSNTKKERTLKASFSQDGGKTQYSLDAKNSLSIMGKKTTILTMENALKVNTPKREVFSLETSGNYKEDKSLKLSGTVDIHRVMRRPATVNLNIVKNAKKRGVRYDVDANIKSNAITSRLDHNTFIKKTGLVSTKTSLDYSIPKMAKNKLTLSGKFNDRSTKAYTKYTMKSNLNVKKNPEYNMGVTFGFDHKKKHSEAELELKYGPNPKDKTKRLYFNTELNRKIPNYKNAMVDYKIQAQAPEHDVDVVLSGKHTHNPKLVDSDIKLSYGKKKDITASLLLKDKSKKLANMNGRASIAWPGSEYVLSSKLDQKNSKISHEIDLKGSDGTRHSIDTVYKNAGSRAHSFSTVFSLQGLKKTTVSGAANLGTKNMELSGEVKYGKDAYGLSTATKTAKFPGAITIEAFNPDRRVVLKAAGQKTRDSVDGSIDASWDVDNDKSKKITLGGSLFKNPKKSIVLGGDMSFTSPFNNFEDLVGSFKYGSDDTEHDINGKFSWGGKQNQIVSSLNLKKPFSCENFTVSFDAKTPFRAMRTISADVIHSWDNTLKTTIKGNLNKENAKLTVQGEGRLNNLKGSASLSSTIKNAEDISGSFEHKHGSGNIENKASLVHKGKSYGYDLSMDHSMKGWRIRNSGKFMLEAPKTKVSSSWQHKNTKDNIKSIFASQWGNKELNVQLSGSHDLDSASNINGELKIQSPWKAMRDVVVSLSHRHGDNLLKTRASLNQDGNTVALSDVKYTKTGQTADLDFKLLSPFHEDLSGKLNTQYGSYPMTSSMEFQWHPRKSISAETSLNVEKLDNSDMEFKLSTPFRGYRNIVARASNKKEGTEMVSRANLDYGKKKSIDLETRHDLSDQNKMVRVKLTTPFDAVETLDTGLRFDGHSTDFVSNADFELIPLVGKFQGSAEWRYDGDLNGKLRVDTPYPDFPYLELSTSSKEKGKMRESRAEVRMHPREIYSLDSVYSFDLPISFEATVRSPYPDYDNLGLMFRHNHSPSSVASSGEIRYHPEKKIDADLNADWSNNVEGTLNINTPFSGYENNRMSVRHQGDLDDFNSHGEINVARQSAVADATFKSAGAATSGTFSLSSPIVGMENINLEFMKKGRVKNFKSDMTLSVNDEKIDANYNHRFTKDGLKGNFKLNTPFTEQVKLSLDHSGEPEKFTNEISASYGRKYDVDSVVSFELSKADVTGNGLLKYKLGGRRNTARLSVNKNGALKDMVFSGTAGLNNDEINVSGSWKNRGTMEGNLKINTPFKGFTSTGLAFSHEGSIDDFRSSAEVTYMDNKNINGQLAFSGAGLERMHLDTEITTPFDELPSASLKVNHNYDTYTRSLNDDVTLTTPVASFGIGSLSLVKTGSIDNLDIVTTAKRNGRQVANLKLANIMSGKEIRSNLDTSMAEYPDLSLAFEHMGDLNDFNTKASAKFGKDNVFGEVSKRGPLEDLAVSANVGRNDDSIEVAGTWNTQRGIDGNLEIKTPFDNFNDIGMSVSHSCSASQASSSATVEYMDDKAITGKVDLSSEDNMRFSSELMTPFQGFEYTKVELEADLQDDLSAKATLTTTVNEFGTAEVTLSKTGGLENMVVEGRILNNNVELANVRITSDQGENDIRGTVVARYDNMPEVTFSLDHSGELSRFTTKARATLGDNNFVEGEANFDLMENKMDADAAVAYSIENIGATKISMEISKDGQLDDFNVKVTGKLNDKEVIVMGEMKLTPEITGSLTINTPFKGYRKVGISFLHNGDMDRFNTEGKINLVDGEEFAGKVMFYRNQYRVIETIVEISTPISNAEFTKFEYRHEGKKDTFTCTATLEYGNSKKITYDLSASTVPDLDFSVSLQTPFQAYENLMASATLENEWPRLSINSKLNAGNGRLVTVVGSLDASKTVTGSLDLTTPIEGFSNIGLNFEHSGKLKNFRSEGRVTYMDGKEISGKVKFNLRRSTLSAELKTPFSGLEYTKLETSQTLTDSEYTHSTYLLYGSGDVVSTDTVINFLPKPGFSVNLRTPVTTYENLMASASFDNSWPKLVLTSEASAGADRKVAIDVVFDASNDISGSVDIKTPLDNFNNVGASFKHSGNGDKFDSEGQVTYMDGKDISGKVNFYRYMWRRLEASAELNTPFTDASFTKAEFNFEDNSKSISTSAALQYGNNKKLDSTIKLTYSPNYEALVTVNTPFKGFREIRASSVLDMTAPSYSASYSIDTNTNTVHSATAKINIYSENNVDGSLELILPIQGWEFTKAEYQHTYDVSQVDGSVSLTYGESQIMSAELKASSVPRYDATVTIKTPFEGYENIESSATYDDNFNKYDISSALKLNRNELYSLTSGLDLSAEPYRASAQVNTPFNDYRNMQLVLTHEGSPLNFHCTGFFSSPLTADINAEANLKYTSPTDMEASTSLRSSFDGMDNLLAEIKNSEVATEKRSHIVVGWTRREQIVFDGLVRHQDNYYGNKLHGSMTLETPFTAVRNLGLDMDHNGMEQEMNQKLNLELNGDKLLDLDTEYSSQSKHQASVTFRKPIAMKYSVAGSSKAGLHEAEIFADWNRDEPNSNVRITSSLNDKSDSYKSERSLDIEVEHATRKVGVSHKMALTQQDIASSGKIFWDADEASQIFYDMQLQDSSRRQSKVRDGYFTLGLPTRTLKLSGACSDNNVVKSGDMTFSWNADRDDKQVSLQGSITRGDSVKGDITLKMPSLRKEIRVDGELMAQNGRVILDARTDISYSQDSRKTLTLTSKLEDISDYYSRYNYSLAVGVSHPYTNVDIQMTSHMGSSDEKMTIGINTDYLTARRQTKNLGLLAEINKLKRQINLQMTNPINKVELIGDVVSTSPYKVRMLSKVDDIESFRSDLTLDEEKKSIELNMFEGSEGMTFWAGYPNKTAFRSEMRRVSYGNDMTESLLAVRLNTTRLLHTRLHWNPELLESLRQEVKDWAISGGVKAQQILAEIDEAVEDELHGKYSEITSHIQEELGPLVQQLEREMTQISRALNKLSKEMKSAYRSNAFYVQDMGDCVTEAYQNTQRKLNTIIRNYKKSSNQLIQSLKEGIEEMSSFPIRERYSDLVSGSAAWLNEKVESALSCLETFLAQTDAALTEYHEKVVEIRHKVKDTMYNGTYVTYISNRLSQMADVDLSPYTSYMTLPEEYSSAIYSAHDTISRRLSQALEAPGLRHVKSGLNEVYQQGIWAYNYWELEENIYNHAHNILKLLREIVEDEMKEYMQDLQGILENPITVWDPQHGEVQAEFQLPMEVARLDEVPDLGPLAERLRAQMPDTSALEKISQTFSDLWKASEDEDELTQELRKYKPSKRMRKVKKGRKYKVRKARN